MTFLLRSLTLASMIAIATVAAYAQGVLSGRVTGPSGQAVPGASIKVSVPNGSFTRGGYSDSRGRYTIKGLPDGSYTMVVTCVGYQKNVAENVEISGATTRDVSLVETAIDMDVTVVTASRVQQKASEAPASVTVVEPRSIREAPKATPVEHIRGLAGIDYSQTGIAQQNVSVRGFNNVFSGSLLTLTDYRPAGVPSLRVNVGYFVPASNEDIERMELVRGPASALYGPNASQGVLNIITRSPFSSQGTTVFLAGGERGLLNAGLRHAGTLGDDFGYKITGQYFSADDWVFEDSTEASARVAALAVPGVNPDTVKIGDRKGSKHERFNVDAGAYYMLGENTMVQINGGISQAVNTIEMTGLGAAVGSDWRYTYANAQLTSGDLFAQVFTNMSDAGNTYFLRTGNPIVDRSTLLGGRLQHAYKVNDDIRLTYGADFFSTNPVTDGTINGVNEENDNYTEIGGYLQGDWKITSDLSALAAVRVDQHSVIGEMVMSPRVALLYKLDENSSIRATFNTAFSNPGTNDLFLDLLSVRDGFGLGRVNPAWSVGIWGASAGRNGYTFNRTGGVVNFISQFDPTRAGWLGVNNAAAGGVWQVVTQIILPQLEAAAPDNLKPLLRPFLTAVPAPSGMKGNLAMLNPNARSAAERFIPMRPEDLQDVSKLRQTSTQTIEIGYQGKLTDKLRVAVDLYQSTVTDFVSPLKVVTPNVFLDGASVTAYLKPLLKGALLGQGIPEAQAEAIASQYSGLIGGAYGQVPVGTASPNETPHKGDVLLAYRNYGKLSYYGSDVAFTYELSPEWAVTGSATWMSQNVFTGADLNDADSTAEIALNAPKYKSALGIMHRNADLGLNIGLQWRWVDGFKMNSGVYVGDVNAYHMLDLTAQYAIPGVDGLSLNLTATNLLDHRVQQFIGAAAIGRLIQGRLTYTF
ncbi:MAG: TonB-dependent receptor [Candidatus Kapabacteria bacterium]|nr:TonB-dependent receptor [Candidatus Kapabacteria bacterium]